jgi:branched-chain amino acid transport system substrate-binding protein
VTTTPSRTIVWLILLCLLAVTLGGVGGPGASAQGAGEPIVIGVPMPVTGNLSQAGQLILWGIQFATDEANRSGGVLGHPLKLLVEDTRGEPNTAATVATKMATQDKVFAFVGGYGSTPDFALLQSIKQYRPIFIHAGSSSTKLEKEFGPQPWYFHVYIWDYHRQRAAARFVESLKPKPETVALAYEDGLYGSDSAKFSNQFFKEAGFKVAMSEPFKSGSPDFSPILNRLKASNADVFFSIGYSGDNIQIVRQAKTLGVKPKLMMIVSAGEKRTDFGDFGRDQTVIDTWAREQKVPGLPEWVKAIEAAKPGGPVLSGTVQGYTAMRTLVDAIKAAGAVDREKVQKALETGTFWTPYGSLRYRKSDMGGLHQLVSEENMVVVQYRDQGQEVVWPAAKANGPLVYPAK